MVFLTDDLQLEETAVGWTTDGVTETFRST